MRRAALSLLIAAALTGCRALPGSLKPSIEAVRPRITGLDARGVDLTFEIDVRNPYPVALKAPRLSYRLAIEGNPWAEGMQDGGLEFPAGATGTAELSMRLTYAEMIRAAAEVAGSNQANYELDGAFLITAFGQAQEIPLSHHGTIPILQMPRLSVVDYSPPEVSLRGAKLNVAADMLNPNVFALGLGQVGYTLRIGGFSIGRIGAASPSEIGAGETSRIEMTAEISAVDALRGLLANPSLGSISVTPTGRIQTPWGPIDLPGG